jgi:hypothetical protein
MELNYAIAFLTSYNRWRRGDVSLNMPNPREIGIALDTVLAAVTEGGTGNSGVERPEPSPHFLQKGTPETDGHLRRNTGNGSEWVRADFARKLERERVEARQQEQIHYDNLLSVQEDRDQWRECAELLAELAEHPREGEEFIEDYIALRARAMGAFRKLKEASK